MEILIKKDSLNKTGSKILNLADDLDNDIKKFESIIENINEVWNGNDALKYINVMKEKYIVGMNELYEVIKNYGNYIVKVPDTYSILDETFSSKNIDV